MTRYTSVYITLVTAAACVLGFIAQIMVARTFGVGASVDAYLATISIPIFLAATINAAFSYAIVPKIIEAENDSNSRTKYKSNLVLVTLVCVFLCLLGSFFVDIQVRGYQGVQIPELRQLFILGWCVGAVQIIYGFIYSVLIAKQFFLRGAFISLCPYIGMLTALIVCQFDPNILYLSIGMLVGILMTIPLTFNSIKEFLVDSNIGLDVDNLKRMADIGGSIVVGVSALTCFSSYLVVDAYWGPRMGDGVLSITGYAQRILTGLGNIVTIGIFTISGPKFKDTLVNHGAKDFKKLVLKLGSIILFSSVMLAVIMFFGIEILIQLIFQSETFMPADTLRLSTYIRFMLPGMVFMLISSVLIKALFCLSQITKMAFFLGVSWPLLYFCFIWLFQAHNLVAISISYSITWFIISITIVGFLIKTKELSPEVVR